MTDAQKRAYVNALYPGPKWKRQVAKMPDDQITAIYLNHLNDGERPEHSEEEEPEPVLEPEPLINDIPRVICGPHAHEDDFPMY